MFAVATELYSDVQFQSPDGDFLIPDLDIVGTAYSDGAVFQSPDGDFLIPD